MANPKFKFTWLVCLVVGFANVNAELYCGGQSEPDDWPFSSWFTSQNSGLLMSDDCYSDVNRINVIGQVGLSCIGDYIIIRNRAYCNYASKLGMAIFNDEYAFAWSRPDCDMAGLCINSQLGWDDGIRCNPGGYLYMIRCSAADLATLQNQVSPKITLKPTPSPTSSTTVKPTSYPTPHPTRNPTKPTVNPTSNPTPHPTVKPTSSPTVKPTNNPTPSPTGKPASNPTPTPTGNPTPNPTRNPTPNPISNPTVKPTPSPIAITITGFSSTVQATTIASPTPVQQTTNAISLVTTGVVESCLANACVNDCFGNCGWDSDSSQCVFGAITDAVELSLNLGNCSSSSSSSSTTDITSTVQISSTWSILPVDEQASSSGSNTLLVVIVAVVLVVIVAIIVAVVVYKRHQRDNSDNRVKGGSIQVNPTYQPNTFYDATVGDGDEMLYETIPDGSLNNNNHEYETPVTTTPRVYDTHTHTHTQRHTPSDPPQQMYDVATASADTGMYDVASAHTHHTHHTHHNDHTPDQQMYDIASSHTHNTTELQYDSVAFANNDDDDDLDV